MKIVKREKVAPNRLYPLVSFSTIDPEMLEDVTNAMKQGIEIEPIKILQYAGEMFVLEGNYEMLAANILKWPEVEIEVVDREALSFWKNEENLLDNIKSISISTLYDFEGVGGFVYDSYPPYYRRG